MPRLIALLSAAFLCLTIPSATATQDDKVEFVKDIQPILKSRCWECHGADKAKGRLRLHRREEVFHTEPGSFSAIVPGDAADSLLVELISLDADDPDIMPAEGDPLSADQIDLIKRWIDQGADWPEGVDPAVKPEHDDGMEPRKLSEGQAKSEADAFAAIGGIGGLVLRVAENTNVVDVNLSLLGEKVTDAELKLLAGLEPTLVWLNLSRTGITDAGLATVAAFPDIRRLNLSNTAITDAGLASIARLAHVEYLNLYGTAVTDAGLKHLAGMKSLQKLYLWRTQATADGAAELAKALPTTRIDRGDYVLADPVPVIEEAPAVVAPADSVVNDSCPLTGQALSADQFVVHEGVKIGFCCANCKAKFEASPADYLEKVKGFAEAKAKLSAAPVGEAAAETAKAPTNTKCPVSGADVDVAVTSEYNGTLVAFCCGSCKKTFDANPAKFADKIR